MSQGAAQNVYISGAFKISDPFLKWKVLFNRQKLKGEKQFSDTRFEKG